MNTVMTVAPMDVPMMIIHCLASRESAWVGLEVGPGVGASVGTGVGTDVSSGVGTGAGTGVGAGVGEAPQMPKPVTRTRVVMMHLSRSRLRGARGAAIHGVVSRAAPADQASPLLRECRASLDRAARRALAALRCRFSARILRDLPQHKNIMAPAIRCKSETRSSS